MPSPSPLDPMALWRDMLAQWEKGANEFGTQAISSGPLMQGAHGGMNTTLQLQKGLAELMARFLGSLNLPSRDNLSALGQQLQRIDEHLERMVQLLDGRAGAQHSGENAAEPPSPSSSPAAVRRPARTRRPPQAAPAPAPAPAKKTRRAR
ncbi:MAG: hypothetical protein QM805_05125 [Pseudomonas sp.]